MGRDNLVGSHQTALGIPPDKKPAISELEDLLGTEVLYLDPLPIDHRSREEAPVYRCAK